MSIEEARRTPETFRALVSIFDGMQRKKIDGALITKFPRRRRLNQQLRGTPSVFAGRETEKNWK